MVGDNTDDTIELSYTNSGALAHRRITLNSMVALFLTFICSVAAL